MAWTQNVALTKSPKCPFVADPVQYLHILHIKIASKASQETLDKAWMNLG